MSTSNEGRCIFCNTKDAKVIHKKTRNTGIVLRVFSHSETTSFEESEYDCYFCHKKYRGFIGTDPSVLRRRLKFSELVLSDLVRMFPNVHRSAIIDIVIDNVIGVGQPKKRGQKLRSEEFDISFMINNRRAYLHCNNEETDLKVISVNEV